MYLKYANEATLKAFLALEKRNDLMEDLERFEDYLLEISLAVIKVFSTNKQHFFGSSYLPIYIPLQTSSPVSHKLSNAQPVVINSQQFAISPFHGYAYYDVDTSYAAVLGFKEEQDNHRLIGSFHRHLKGPAIVWFTTLSILQPAQSVEEFYCQHLRIGKKLGKSELDMLIKFVNGLPSKLCFFVRTGHPSTLKEA
ncbi:hypothetical protein KUTeg_023897 [Tegillarca granosa]|uniref:Retrotransposon gag domain-containing protein n=1 Tax=Tegillarca granosa TaxID=220873 RepID=A0ABQ9DZQ3_TEGGR|nr:hypothetical protein KUTeg_023897 [Tegillarca granosa]